MITLNVLLYIIKDVDVSKSLIGLSLGILVLLTACGAREETALVYPAQVTYQGAKVSVTKDSIVTSEVEFETEVELNVERSRVTVSDGVKEASYKEEICRHQPCFTRHTSYLLNGDYRDGVNIKIISDSKLWPGLVSTLHVNRLPTLSSDSDRIQATDVIRLDYELPADSSSAELVISYSESENLKTLKAIDINESSLMVSYQEINKAIGDSDQIYFFIVSKINGKVASEFAGGEIIGEVRSEPLVIDFSQTQ